MLSGDLSAFGGYIRPMGFQYDLLFGNRQFYGIAGINYDLLRLYTQKPSLIIGFGTDFGNSARGGFQISLMHSLPEYYPDGHMRRGFMTLSLGIKMDFLNAKRRYR